MLVALLDAQDIFIGMVDINPRDATDRHLTRINECDLPVNRYKWIPDRDNLMGGSFVAKAYLDRLAIEAQHKAEAAARIAALPEREPRVKTQRRR